MQLHGATGNRDHAPPLAMIPVPRCPRAPLPKVRVANPKAANGFSVTFCYKNRGSSESRVITPSGRAPSWPGTSLFAISTARIPARLAP
jgi:hypothetical protein